MNFPLEIQEQTQPREVGTYIQRKSALSQVGTVSILRENGKR